MNVCPIDLEFVTPHYNYSASVGSEPRGTFYTIDIVDLTS